MENLIEIWKQICESNLFNFVVMVLLLAWLVKKFDLGAKIEAGRKKIESNIAESETVKEETVETYGIDEYSDYARVFDEGNSNWKNNNDYNLMFLGQVQNWANMRLKQRGYLFLNEVYDALGMRGSAEGQIVGWTDHGEDQYVSLGIDNNVAFCVFGLYEPTIIVSVSSTPS